MRYSGYIPLAVALIAAACNDGPTSPGDLELGLAGATGKVSITATQTADGFWEERREYDWTAQRYVSEIHVGHDMRLLPERDRVEILPGQTVWVTFQVDAQRRIASEITVKGVRGETCVRNTGRSAIKDFVIVEQVVANVNGHWKPVDGATTILRVNETIEAGTETCFDYEILFEAQPGAEYRVVAAVAAHVGAFAAAHAFDDFTGPLPSDKRTVEIDAEAWMRDGAFAACVKTLGPDFTCTSIEGIPRDQRIGPPTGTGHLGMSFMVDIKNEGVCEQTFIYTINEPLREGGPKPPGGEIREVSGSLVITTGPCLNTCPLPAAGWRARYGDGSDAAVAAEYYGIHLGQAGDDNKSLFISGPDLVRFVFARAGVTNPIGELYAQLYTAKLNIARGVDPRPVRDVRIAADAFLTTHTAQDWDSLTETQRKAINDWVKVLTDYNEGRLGPAGCGAPPPPPPPSGDGCTRTIGYWKNHAGFGPQADVVTPLLPIWLGTAAGAKSIAVTSAGQAVTLLNKSSDASNGINKLYAQLLAAKLNIKSGADGSAVVQTITHADVFLATHDAASWGSLSATERQQVLAWMTRLDDYNNGRLGPGHCD